MRVLVVGAGVIGTVYGAHLAAAGNTVSVLSHGPRTDEVAAGGLSARDVLGGGRAREETTVVPDAGGDYGVVLVAVRSDQLASACAELAGLAGKPAIVLFGNNPAGRPAITGDMPGDVYLRVSRRRRRHERRDRRLCPHTAAADGAAGGI
jgi:2-dehydropantoate 2-reductase